MSQKLPPCGIYRTLAQVGDVPAGRLVYFHNHGDPGPGVYLPERWSANRAHFQARGHVLATPLHEQPEDEHRRGRGRHQECENRVELQKASHVECSQTRLVSIERRRGSLHVEPLVKSLEA